MRTRVGYCGGTKTNPTYHSLGDHSESIQIDFDPKVISYAQLVQEALAQGSFGSPSYSRQYRSVIFYHTPQQKEVAEKSCSSVEPVGVFTRAEDYHQKYYLQQSSVVKDFYAMFPGEVAFTDATATMRANAIVGGYLARPQVEALLPQLGVGPSTGQAVLKLAGQAERACAAP